MDEEKRVGAVDLEGFASASGLDAIFAPSSVAVVGASGRKGSVGRAVFKNILESDYSGVIYPVNIKARSVCGVRAYPSLADIPDPVDLAVVIVPAAMTPAVAREAAAKGVRGLIVISAGFKETGPAGAAIEEELLAVCREHGIRLVGPTRKRGSTRASPAGRPTRATSLLSVSPAPSALRYSILPPRSRSAFPNSSRWATRRISASLPLSATCTTIRRPR